MIPIYKPYLTNKSLKYAHDAINSTWISSKGKYIESAENLLKEKINAKFVKLVNNGTSATHLTVKALLYKNPEIKRIIVPNNVYVAAWNSIMYEGLELVPYDAEINTWNININNLPDSITEDTAIMLVHNIGNINNINKIKNKYKNTLIIEDNCEGFMGKYGEKYSGTECLASSLSFFANKTITAGEGGAFITNDEDIYEFINSSQGQGQKKGYRYIHDKLGYNYRITNIQAAILLGQLECLEEIIEQKERVFKHYKEYFKNIDNIHFQKKDKKTTKAKWMFAIRTNKKYSFLEKKMKEKNIETRSMFFPMSAHKHLAKFANPNEEKIAKKLNKKCILLPSFPQLTKDELDYICETLVSIIKE